jgi:hypothetical protein
MCNIYLQNETVHCDICECDILLPKFDIHQYAHDQHKSKLICEEREEAVKVEVSASGRLRRNAAKK